MPAVHYGSFASFALESLWTRRMQAEEGGYGFDAFDRWALPSGRRDRQRRHGLRLDPGSDIETGKRVAVKAIRRELLVVEPERWSAASA